MVLAALLALPTAAVASPGYDPGNTGYHADESKLNASTVGDLRLRWKVSVPSEQHCNTVSTPDAAGGRLFTTAPDGVLALDPATGKRLWHWTFPEPGEHFGRLAVAGNQVITLTNPCEYGPGKRAYLTGLDAATGRQRWRVRLDQYTNILVVADGIAAVGNWGGFDESPVGTTAFRITDGTQVWSTTGYRLGAGVAAGSRVLLSNSKDQSARAVSLRTGRTLWETRKSWTPLAADPAGTRFLVSTESDGTTSVDAATGAVQWTTKHDGGLADDGRNVYLSYHLGVEVRAARTGRIVRTLPLSARTSGDLVRAGGLLYLMSSGVKPMTALDPTTGKVIAMPPIKYGPPAIIDGRLYTSDGTSLRAYAP